MTEAYDTGTLALILKPFLIATDLSQRAYDHEQKFIFEH